MTVEKFWMLVTEPNANGCRLWRRSRNQCGYGTLRHADRPWLAHRWIWAHTHGAIPNGYNVCHHCDVPACCALDHLFLGTQADNMGDAARKGRMFVHAGILHGRAIVDDEMVREMRAMHAAGVRNGEIAQQFGLTRTHAWSITHGKTWKHIARAVSA